MGALADELARVEMRTAREWAVAELPADRLDSSVIPLRLLCWFHQEANQVLLRFQAGKRDRLLDRRFANLGSILKRFAVCAPADITAEEHLALAKVHGNSAEPSRVFAWEGQSHVFAILRAWESARIDLIPFINLFSTDDPASTIDLGRVEEFAESYSEFLYEHPHWNDGVELAWTDDKGGRWSDPAGTIPCDKGERSSSPSSHRSGTTALGGSPSDTINSLQPSWRDAVKVYLWLFAAASDAGEAPENREAFIRWIYANRPHERMPPDLVEYQFPDERTFTTYARKGLTKAGITDPAKQGGAGVTTGSVRSADQLERQKSHDFR